MKIAEHGFMRWFFWAFFSWRGEMKRLPYAISFMLLVLVVKIYVASAAQWLAVNVLPPPAGMPLDPAYAASLTLTTAIIPFFIPVCYVYIVLDVKRLRSIGAPVFLAFLFSGLTPFAPIFAPQLSDMMIMTTFAYHAILAVVPAKEDRISPLEKKARTWKRIATGDGTPRRLRGKDIKAWRIVRQGPAKED